MRYIFFTIILLAIETSANCQCGYFINTNSTTGEQTLFTDSLQTDFTRFDDVTWDSSPGPDWRVQAYNVSPEASRGPYGKSASVQNVVSNLLPATSIGGPGVDGSDPGLELWVRSQLIPGSDGIDGQLVPISEIVSTREDILYGSFRAGLKSTTVNGTCAAFFFYHNDSQEIDMELLSKQTQGNTWKINFVNQSPGSVANGYNAANTSGLGILGLQFNPTSAYAEYRFDWLPDRIDFYTDGVLGWTMTENIPTDPGAIHLIHWSNGDPGWSAGPPQEDAVLVVSYVNAYFNSSMNSTQQASAPCDNTAPDATCSISDNAGPPSQPDVPNPTQTNPAGTASASASASPKHSGAKRLSTNASMLSWAIVALISAVSIL